MFSVANFFGESDAIVIYDTEFTTWEGALERGWSGPGEHRELVQIAAQRVELSTRSKLDSFECLIQPRINPILSSYFTSLTNITQSDITNSGIGFAEAYTKFNEWRGSEVAYSYSKRVTDYTDADVLRENIHLSCLSWHVPKTEFKLLTPLFQAVGIDTNAYNSGKLYQAFNLSLESHHEHNAMDDVHSLTRSLFCALEQLKSPL